MPGSSPGMTFVDRENDMWSPLLRGLLTLLLLTLAATAHAQTAPAGFQSPSKNIACQYFDYDKQNILRCDIAAMETKPRRPADCELDYGGAFEMNAKGPAARICHGDTVMDKSLPVLAYGEVVAARRVYLQVGADRASPASTPTGAGFRWRGRSRRCFETRRSRRIVIARRS